MQLPAAQFLLLCALSTRLFSVPSSWTSAINVFIQDMRLQTNQRSQTSTLYKLRTTHKLTWGNVVATRPPSVACTFTVPRDTITCITVAADAWKWLPDERLFKFLRPSIPNLPEHTTRIRPCCRLWYRYPTSLWRHAVLHTTLKMEAGCHSETSVLTYETWTLTIHKITVWTPPKFDLSFLVGGGAIYWTDTNT